MVAPLLADDSFLELDHKVRATFSVDSPNPTFLVELQMVNRTTKSISGWGEHSPIGLIRASLQKITDDNKTANLDEHVLRPIIPLRLESSQLNELPAKDLGEDLLAPGQSVSVAISIALKEDHMPMFPGAKTPYLVKGDGRYKVVFTSIKNNKPIDQIEFEVATSTIKNRTVTILKSSNRP